MIKCGTPGYVDPEVLNDNGFTFKSDIFSLGSLMFNMITRKFIFKGSTHQELLYRNKNECPQETIKYWCQRFTPECRDLLSKMLARTS
jgi:serine/threonine protein kinase